MRQAGERRDRGASAAEYALLIGAIAAVVVFVVFTFGGIVRGMFDTSCQNVASELNTSC